MSQPVIGLMGKAGAGKDAVADFLVDAYSFQKFGFSWPLKTLVAREFGLDRSRMDDLEYKETATPNAIGPNGLPRTCREILQIIGTEGFRAVDPDYWVKRACKEIDKLLAMPETRGVVLTDVRFANEAEILRVYYRGGVIWEVRKVGGPGTLSTMHSSETELATITPNAVLTANHGDIAGLHVQAASLLTL